MPGRFPHDSSLTLTRLWEKSWDDGAAKWQASPEIAYDAEKIHRIEYLGKYHKFSGYGQVHPSPQRTPVLFQAGASKSGIDFAGNHAEGICKFIISQASNMRNLLRSEQIIKDYQPEIHSMLMSQLRPMAVLR